MPEMFYLLAYNKERMLLYILARARRSSQL